MAVRGILAALFLVSTSGMAAAQAETGAESARDTTAAALAAPPAADSLVIGRVTYVVGPTVYLDVGADRGVTEGSTGDLEREGKVLGRVRVTYLSSRRASCEVIDPGVIPQTGDLVRLRVVPATGIQGASPAAAAPIAAAAVSGKGWLREAGLRGRVGLRYLSVHDRGDLGDHFSQPAVDLNLRGTAIGGSPIDLFADVRARRTYRTLGEDDGRTRVYLLGAGWNTSSLGPRVSLGRQLPAGLPSLGVFDGGRAEYAWSRTTLGAFVGAEPDPVDYSMSGDIVDCGVYSQVQGKLATHTNWRASGGLVTSIAQGEPNRDFLFIQGQLQGRTLLAYGSQEVDLNRGWKADVEGSSVSWTNSFASVRWQLVPSLALRSSFDNRRNVRLYRDHDTPESDFDDGYRQGFAVGGEWRPERTWGLDLGYRSSRGEHGDARAGTAIVRALRLPPGLLSASLRLTRYDGPEVTGWLYAATLGWSGSGRIHGEVHGGLRSEDRSVPIDAHEDVVWFGADLDVGLWGGWYFLLSAEATRGTAEHMDQGYASLSYRF